MSSLEIVPGSTGADTLCFDSGTGFDVSHYGKFINPDLELCGPYTTAKPPRGHCIVAANDTKKDVGPGLFVVRYTPYDRSLSPTTVEDFNNPLFDGLVRAVPRVDDAAELHERHLHKLSTLGLYPWMREIKIGTPLDLAPAVGLCIIQDLLPDDAHIGLQDKNGLCDFDAFSVIKRRIGQYRQWASMQNEPAYLSDIEAPSQFSKVAGELVLHDVEPIYKRFRNPRQKIAA